MRLGMQELIVILIIVVIIFGPKQIPKLTRMLGRAARSFKDGLEGDKTDNSKTGASKSEGAKTENSKPSDGEDV